MRAPAGRFDAAAVLARYDAQLRRDARAGIPGARVERDGPVVRWVADDPAGWEAVIFSDVDTANADEVIAGQLAYFRERGRRFEWKHHSYDLPADLADRLRAAGLQPEPAEALMVAETATLSVDGPPPPGITLRPVRSAEEVDMVVGLREEVFGSPDDGLRQQLTSRLAEPESGAAVLAMDGRRPVCAGRVEFHPGSDFASLWGGGTLPQWRGRGIYRAVVGYRAALARARGRRYLQVDASAQSEPILLRLGFVRLATTTPYVWQPGT